MATAVLLEPRVTELERAMAKAWRAIAEASAMAKEASAAAADASRAVEQLTLTVAQTSRTAEQTSREMAEFKKEMAEFKDESRIDREQSRKELREMNRQWGALANKMGTMAEDLVAPSIPRILRTLFGCPDDAVEEMAVRVRRRSQLDRTIGQEFDVITACGDWFLINETKSTLAPEDVTDFVEILANARQFFPEQAHRQIVGVIASLYVDESLVRHAERNGLIVLSFGDEGMDLRNSEGFSPRVF